MQKMKTDVIHIKNNDLSQIEWAAERILEGGIIAFPTETVYGIGASAHLESAMKRVYEVKGRPADNPSIVHVADIATAMGIAHFTEEAEQLANKFWPGPLTLVLPKSIAIPDIVTAGLDTVAIRMPNNIIALELIRHSCPIAAPSANISGRPSATRASHVLKDFDGMIYMIIDGGPTKIGLESTIIDLSHRDPKILRVGGVTKEQLEKALGRNIGLHPSILNSRTKDKEAAKAPGMKYKHYAPKAQVVLFEVNGERLPVLSEMVDIGVKLNMKKRKVAFILSDQLPEGFVQIMQKYGTVYPFSDERQMAHGIYNRFRHADDDGIDVILVEGVEPFGFGLAIMDRLRRAANGNVVKTKAH